MSARGGLLDSGGMELRRRARAAIAAILVMASVASAQEVTEPALKAAFIYSFMKFTEWPEPLPATDPFVICVLNAPAVASALERTIKGREFAGRRMTVSIDAPGPKAPCRVLYVSGVTPSRGAELISELRDSPVLTISDLEWFVGAGGMAQLFYERGQLRFNIGLTSVKRSKLLMSSKLLVLAKRYE